MDSDFKAANEVLSGVYRCVKADPEVESASFDGDHNSSEIIFTLKKSSKTYILKLEEDK